MTREKLEARKAEYLEKIEIGKKNLAVMQQQANLIVAALQEIGGRIKEIDAMLAECGPEAQPQDPPTPEA